jgi:hypothetical protein
VALGEKMNLREAANLSGMVIPPSPADMEQANSEIRTLRRKLLEAELMLVVRTFQLADQIEGHAKTKAQLIAAMETLDKWWEL